MYSSWCDQGTWARSERRSRWPTWATSKLPEEVFGIRRRWVGYLYPFQKVWLFGVKVPRAKSNHFDKINIFKTLFLICFSLTQPYQVKTKLQGFYVWVIIVFVCELKIWDINVRTHSNSSIFFRKLIFMLSSMFLP